MVTAEVEVTSFHSGPDGGGILIGWPECRRTRPLRARLPHGRTVRAPRAGETWRITGVEVEDPVHGPQIAAEIAMPLMPTGAGVVRWIATSRSIPGVGERTATSLWASLGEDLYRRLREGDVATVAKHVGPIAGSAIVDAFRLLADEVEVLAVYDRHGVDPRAAAAACALWGRSAIERLAADPYCINVVERWRRVDERALRLGILPDDPRRLRAAVAEACSRRYSGRDRGMGGHMAATPDELAAAVAALLGPTAADYASRAVDLALREGDLVRSTDGLLQSRACRLMEQQLADSIAARLARPREPVDRAVVDGAIAEVETELGFPLEPEQCRAVRESMTNGVSVIDGGAGTGKSTVVRAVARATERLGRPYVQMALSGRAAKRLRDATGRDAVTIHRFLKDVVHGVARPCRGTVLIDETSMLGTPDLWQLMSWLPAHVDVVLVGDPAQLAPIAAGNPFPVIVGSPGVPRTTLVRIHRQAGGNAIPGVADAIRHGSMPDLPEFDPARADREGVFLLRADQRAVAEATISAFEAMAGPTMPGGGRDALRAIHGARTQLLGATIAGDAGVRALSEAIERRWLAEHQDIHDWGLSVGSKILWTRNSYDHPVIVGDDPDAVVDLMNGSLGIVQRATTDSAVVLFDDADSTRAEIRRADLQRVARGWAVTVHKAQGSGFERVIMPVARSRLLDRLLVYTAITRAMRTVVLVGDEELLRRAVEAPPRARLRRQCLDVEAAIGGEVLTWAQKELYDGGHDERTLHRDDGGHHG
jgi:exodeoxyribonuclease V alpha subunit